MTADLEKMNNQARFIKMIIDGELVINRKKKAALVSELKAKGFKAIPKVVDARKSGEFEAVVGAEEGSADEAEEVQATGSHDYDYLLGVSPCYCSAAPSC